MNDMRRYFSSVHRTLLNRKTTKASQQLLISTVPQVRIAFDSEDMRPHRSQQDIGNATITSEKLALSHTNKTKNAISNDEAITMFSDDVRYHRHLHRTLQDYSPSILYHDEDFCVIDKPYDVRMDGDFDITVQRLVASWLSVEEKTLKWIHQLDFATSGVLCIGLNRLSTAAASSSFEHRQTKKEYLAILQGHVQLDDWPLLTSPLPYDFPNLSQYSDITQKNSHHQSIINRKLSRKRPAPSSSTSSISIHNGVNDSKTPPIIDRKEDMDPTETIPFSSSGSSGSWQDEVMMKNLQICLDSFHGIQQKDHQQYQMLQELITNNLQWRQDYERLKDLSLHDFQTKPKFRKVLRKLLQNCGVELKLIESSPNAVQQPQKEVVQVSAKDQGNLSVASTEDSNIEAENHHTSPTTAQPPVTKALSHQEVMQLCTTIFQDKTLAVPFIYHLRQNSEDTANEASSIAKDCLVVNIPVAEVDGDFRMEPGHRGNPGKTSITEVYILDHMMYKGQPVTKVLMKPLTGRRHQLRIHSLCLGHPIVGDYTYNEYHRKLIDEIYANSESSDAENITAVVNDAMKSLLNPADLLADRMMLHAHRLKIPFPTVGKCTEAFRDGLVLKYLSRTNNAQNSNNDSPNDRSRVIDFEALSVKEKLRILTDTPLVQVQAPDPFIVQNGELVVSL